MIFSHFSKRVTSVVVSFTLFKEGNLFGDLVPCYSKRITSVVIFSHFSKRVTSVVVSFTLFKKGNLW